VAEGVVEVRGEPEVGGGGWCMRAEAKVSKSRCGGRAHGSGAAAGAHVVARSADLSRVRERERQGTRHFFE
jgi:hypothetical protein